MHPLGRTAGAQPAAYERVQLPIHHSLDVARFHTSPQVLYHPIGLEYITADLVAPRDAPFFAVKSFHLSFLSIQSLGVEFGEQQPHRRRPILVLGALIL